MMSYMKICSKAKPPVIEIEKW